MLKLSDIKTLAKSMAIAVDTAWDRPWRLYSNGTRIVEHDPANPENNTNPRIRELPIEQLIELTGQTDKIVSYEARIIKHDSLKPLIRSSNTWEISFNGGVSKTQFQPLLIKEHRIQDFAWIVILVR